MAPDMTRLYNPSEINNNNRSIIEINANIDDYVKKKKTGQKKSAKSNSTAADFTPLRKRTK